MKHIEQEDFVEDINKPSLNSMIEHRNRKKAMHRAALLDESKKENEGYTDSERKMMEDAKKMSLIAHLDELRHRIIIILVVFLAASMASYYYVDEILQFLVEPAGKLYYMKPTEAFFTYMKVSFFSGFVISSPIIFYHIWAFVVPALTVGERKVSNWFVPIMIILFLSGILFSYFLVLPAAVKFFIGFATDELQPLFSVGQYLNFILSFLLPFGIVFELPVLMILLAKFNIVTSSFLKSKRKIMIFASFVIGAAISPTPDMFSQIMIAIPMILLYEISIFFVSVFMKK